MFRSIENSDGLQAGNAAKPESPGMARADLRDRQAGDRAAMPPGIVPGDRSARQTGRKVRRIRRPFPDGRQPAVAAARPRKPVEQTAGARFPLRSQEDLPNCTRKGLGRTGFRPAMKPPGVDPPVN